MMPKDYNLDFEGLEKKRLGIQPYKITGKIYSNKGMGYLVSMANAIVGNQVLFKNENGESCEGEVIGIEGSKCFVMPYKEMDGINPNTKIILQEKSSAIKLSDNLLGRVVDFQCRPIDKLGEIGGPYKKHQIYNEPLNPLERPQITDSIDTGINAINSFMTMGKGQRMAIMAGSGVGKSVLMGMIARNTNADINVIALVGERGREVLEFIKSDLGEEGLKRSVVIVATSDNSALMRVKAAYAALTVAEYFRDKGKDVMLMMDSVTRFAMAQREIGISLGEPPGQKGYPPSVFNKLPKLLERVGTKENSGSITGIFTVLVEGGDFDEPITDAIRAIADGHIMLNRDLAAKGQYPAIDILQSISRIMNKVVSNEHKIVAAYLKELLASYKDNEDLISVGAYVQGTNPKADKAILIYNDIVELLKQNIGESSSMEEIYDRMVELAKKAEGEGTGNSEQLEDSSSIYNVL